MPTCALWSFPVCYKMLCMLLFSKSYLSHTVVDVPTKCLQKTRKVWTHIWTLLQPVCLNAKSLLTFVSLKRQSMDFKGQSHLFFGCFESISRKTQGVIQFCTNPFLLPLHKCEWIWYQSQKVLTKRKPVLCLKDVLAGVLRKVSGDTNVFILERSVWRHLWRKLWYPRLLHMAWWNNSNHLPFMKNGKILWYIWFGRARGQFKFNFPVEEEETKGEKIVVLCKWRGMRGTSYVHGSCFPPRSLMCFCRL